MSTVPVHQVPNTQGEHNAQTHSRLSKLERFMHSVLIGAPKHVIDFVDGKSNTLDEPKVDTEESPKEPPNE